MENNRNSENFVENHDNIERVENLGCEHTRQFVDEDVNRNIVVENNEILIISENSNSNVNLIPASSDIVLNDADSDITFQPKQISANCFKESVQHYCSQPQSDESQCCPICLEPWNNAGDHRIVSLKCGHLFGQNCIIRWLQNDRQKCPQCNVAAKKRDIRIIYAKSIVVNDTAEINRVTEDLAKERASKRQLELDYFCLKFQIQLYQKEIAKLQNEIDNLKNSVQKDTQISVQEPNSGIHLKPKKYIDINKNGECRVMAYSSEFSLLVISQPSNVSLFPGFGIKKVDMIDIRVTELFPLHQKQIRDLVFNPHNQNILLSVSLDCTAKLINVLSNNVMKVYRCSAPIWACCWDSNDPSLFYLGLQSGAVYLYDIREENDSPKEISCFSSSVVRMCFVQKNLNMSFPLDGLLVTRLNSCSFHEKCVSNYNEIFLAKEGPYTSMCFDNDSYYMFVVARPCCKYPHARYILGDLRVVSQPDCSVPICTWNILHIFTVDTAIRILSRPCIFSDPDKKTRLICIAGLEQPQEIRIWDSNGSCLQTVTVSERILDICLVTVNCEIVVVMLTEKRLYVFDWTS